MNISFQKLTDIKSIKTPSTTSKITDHAQISEQKISGENLGQPQEDSFVKTSSAVQEPVTPSAANIKGSILDPNQLADLKDKAAKGELEPLDEEGKRAVEALPILEDLKKEIYALPTDDKKKYNEEMKKLLDKQEFNN